MTRSWFLLITLLLLCKSASSAVNFNPVNASLSLDDHMEFALSDSPSSDALHWVKDASSLDRQAHQYLHFRVNIKNTASNAIPVWFSIGFPAMKTLVVQSGEQVWKTGDAYPFTSREIHVSNYHFPILLNEMETTKIQGYMAGEILRYSFVVGTPEYFTNMYVNTIQRDMAFFGAMALLTVLCLLGFIASRNIVFLSFATFIFATTFWFFRVFGYAFELLWPQYPSLNDISYAISIYAVLLSSFWVVFASLAKEGHHVFGSTWVKRFCFSLPIIGIIVWQTVGLDLALRLPVLLFFLFIVVAVVVITVEHRRGSDRAKWLACAMFPVTLSTFFLIIVALFDVDIELDPVATFMSGVVLTCLFIVALTTRYMVNVVQRERDAQKVAAQTKAQQAAKLEQLVKQRTLELEKTNEVLAKLASYDALTGLPNRRSIDFFVDESFASGNENTTELFIALLDLDHFKNINDTYGHETGDIVLKAVAKTLAPLNNDNQIAGRYGGEEFAIVQRIDKRMSEPKHPSQGKAPASQTAKSATQEHEHFLSQLQKVHRTINSLVINDVEGIHVGVSIGWAHCSNAESIVDTFRRADSALYRAKDKGRNLIING
ncbi:hypothetical protein KUL152_02210 [Tenacibaculum sp. KUL152]|nr:hypothetical protein KUL152_02210 [Tenacibaculum sp. KUL152]